MQPACWAAEDAGDPVGIRVVDEADLHQVATGVAQRVRYKHRPQCRTADADGQHMGELDGVRGSGWCRHVRAPANRLISARVLRISAAIAGDGASSGARSQ